MLRDVEFEGFQICTSFVLCLYFDRIEFNLRLVGIIIIIHATEYGNLPELVAKS